MRLYLDSSALVKRYIFEPGSESVITICEKATEIGLSVLGYPEVVSCLNRLRRQGRLSDAEYRKVKKDLELDLEDATVIGITDGVLNLAVRCLELEPVRAADSLHVASAHQFACDLFISADGPQCTAAERFGLRARVV